MHAVTSFDKLFSNRNKKKLTQDYLKDYSYKKKKK